MITPTLLLVHNRSSGADFSSHSLAPKIPTILICDNLLLCSGLQNILQGTSFALIDSASATVVGRLHSEASRPALVIIKIKQNVSRLVEVVSHVKEQFPEARIVVLADQFDLNMVRLGSGAGVNGFCLEDSAPEVLIKSFELVMLGENILPSAVLRVLLQVSPKQQGHPLRDNRAEPTLPNLGASKLSARETEILRYLKDGEPNKVIARELEIAEATIKVHVKAILRKIGAANRTQAAMWACQHLSSRGATTQNV
jgi:two-component system nitrate/nitrite response regulator NarL